MSSSERDDDMSRTKGKASPCSHSNFRAKVEVSRITAKGDVQLTNLYADIRVWCNVCGEPMRFIGVDPGMSPRQPMSEVGGLELRCPIQPESADPGWGMTGVGYHVTRSGAREN